MRAGRRIAITGADEATPSRTIGFSSKLMRSGEVKFAAKLDAYPVEYNYYKYQGQEAGTGEIQKSNK
jgi:hypothetical protein